MASPILSFSRSDLCWWELWELSAFCFFFSSTGFCGGVLVSEINRSIRSALKSFWLDGCLNVIRSNYHLVARICVLGGRFQEVLFGVWSRSPNLLD